MTKFFLWGMKTKVGTLGEQPKERIEEIFVRDESREKELVLGVFFQNLQKNFRAFLFK